VKSSQGNYRIDISAPGDDSFNFILMLCVFVAQLI